MDIEIRELAPSLIEDYLGFFDSQAFTDHEDWSYCYCTSFNIEDEADKETDEAFAASGRDVKVLQQLQKATARRLIEEGKLTGYLAYVDDQPVAFCNARDKAVCQRFHWNAELDPFIRASGTGKVMIVACFIVAPEFRNRGVASALMSRVIADAKEQGYDAVEGYPRLTEEHEKFDYTGPKHLFEKYGFEPVASKSVVSEEVWGNGCRIMRKELSGPELSGLSQ